MIPVTVYGKEMYAYVYRTTDKRAKIEHKVDQEQKKLTSDITQMCKREFFCEADALIEIKAFLKVHSNLMSDVDLSVISEVTLKRPRCRPGRTKILPRKPRCGRSYHWS